MWFWSDFQCNKMSQSRLFRLDTWEAIMRELRLDAESDTSDSDPEMRTIRLMVTQIILLPQCLSNTAFVLGVDWRNTTELSQFFSDHLDCRCFSMTTHGSQSAACCGSVSQSWFVYWRLIAAHGHLGAFTSSIDWLINWLFKSDKVAYKSIEQLIVCTHK